MSSRGTVLGDLRDSPVSFSRVSFVVCVINYVLVVLVIY